MRVVKDWLDKLTLKQQTVLLCAIRGCDGAPKGDISKELVRLLRNTVLENACPEDNTSEFMQIKASTVDEIMGMVKDLGNATYTFMQKEMTGSKSGMDKYRGKAVTLESAIRAELEKWQAEIEMLNRICFRFGETYYAGREYSDAKVKECTQVDIDAYRQEEELRDEMKLT